VLSRQVSSVSVQTSIGYLSNGSDFDPSNALEGQRDARHKRYLAICKITMCLPAFGAACHSTREIGASLPMICRPCLPGDSVTKSNCTAKDQRSNVFDDELPFASVFNSAIMTPPLTGRQIPVHSPFRPASDFVALLVSGFDGE
jgi:hypothetical protein